MARTPVEGSGQGPSSHQPASHQPVILHENAAGAFALPGDVNVADMQMSRDGENLTLTAPDGQVFVVENYFSMPDAPLIISANGSLLSPALVQSFLDTSLNAIEVAAGPQVASDHTAVGEVSDVTGNATVTHSDGSKEKITQGTQIFEGDVIETDAKGAVNIKFADDSTFAVSQNARMAVDDFSFNSHDQSGSTGISILRGVFMFTSGLVGRENPDAVHLNTPVGSIGIRGTIIGGEINPHGHSQISVLEGAIVVHNGAGEQILSNQFETVQLSGFNAPITHIGTLTASQMTESYGAVRAVSPTLFTSIDDTARDHAQPQPGQQPQQQQTQPQPDGTHTQAPTQTHPDDSQSQGQPQQAPQSGLDLNQPTVFQTLTTGSNLENPVGTSGAISSVLQQGPIGQTPPPSATSLGSALPPPPAPVNQTQGGSDTQSSSTDNPLPPPVKDTRPPSTVVFANDDVIGSVNEDAHGGAPAGAVHQLQSLPFAVTYSLTDDAGGLFVINPTTGQISVAAGHQTGDLDAGAVAPYNITVHAARADNAALFTDTPLTLTVAQVDEAPVFAPTTGLTVDEYQTAATGATTLTAAMLHAVDPEGASMSTFTYKLVETHHGVLEHYTGSTWVAYAAGDTIDQSLLSSSNIRFRQDGTEPNATGGDTKILFTVQDAQGNTSPTQTINVTVNPTNDSMVQDISAQAGSILESQPGAPNTVVIDNTRLHWTDVDNTAAQVTFTVQSLSNGTLERFNGTAWVNLSVSGTFTQADIDQSHLRFTQDGSETSSAGFTYGVSDGTASSTGSMAFTVSATNDTPVIQNNITDTILEAGHSQLTDSMLNVTDADNTAAQLTYDISAQTNGYTARSTDGGTTFTATTHFTQQDVHDGLIYFVHDGSETTTGSFNFSAHDPIGATTTTVTHSFNVTPVNDQPSSLSVASTASIGENTTATTVLSNVDFSDGEENTADPNHYYTFDVQYKDGSGNWITDNTHFGVNYAGGHWQLVAKGASPLDHETTPAMDLRVVLTDNDGTTTLSSNSGMLHLTVADVNELPDNLSLNNGQQISVSGGTADGVVSGNLMGNFIAVVTNNDPDTSAGNLLTAANYKILGIGGNSSGLSISDFKFVDYVDDHGHSEVVLALDPAVSKNFASAQTFTLDIQMDSNQDGFHGDDPDHVFGFVGRNDLMVLEAVNGKNGFLIENDSRFPSSSHVGAGFGAALGVGDFDGNGSPDIVIGAPLAQNGAGELTGGIYAFNNDSAFATDAANGDVTLRTITGIGTSPYSNPGDYNPLSDGVTGFSTELPATNDGHMFGSRLAVLRNFDGHMSSGADVAVVNGITNGSSTFGSVVIYNASGAIITAINNIPNGGTTGDDLVKSISVASVGDINGDGLSDLVIGAAQATSGMGNGALVYGSTSLPSASSPINYASLGTYGVALTPNTGNSTYNIGSQVVGIGDINGDRYNDFIISGNGDGLGHAYIYYGSINGISGTTTQINGNSTTHLSDQVAGAGDFNGDSFNDLMLRSVNDDGGSGSIKIVFGNGAISSTSVADMSAFNTSNTGAFHGVNIQWTSGGDANYTVGNAFSSAGDLNGDGFGDIVIDVAHNVGSGNYQHMLYVVFGQDTNGMNINLGNITDTLGSLSTGQAYKILLEDTTSVGVTVKSAGDINGDGYDDLLIGNPGATQGNPADVNAPHDGEAYVVYGGNYNAANVTAVHSTTATAVSNGDAFIGDSANNTVDSNGNLNMTFNGGLGDDTLRIQGTQSAGGSAFTAVREFDGGMGDHDTLKLFFSKTASTTENPNSPTANTIDLTGIGSHMTGVEVIQFDAGSYTDTLKLDIKDVLSLMNTSNTHTLTISMADDGSAIYPLDANTLRISQDGTSKSLSTLGFTDGGTASLHSANDAHVYINTNTGFELIVDNRIANAGNILGTPG